MELRRRFKLSLADEFFAVGTSPSSFFKVLSRMASPYLLSLRVLLFTSFPVLFLLTSARDGGIDTPQSASLTASSVRHSQSASFASSLAALLASLDSSAAIAATGCAASFVPLTQGSLLGSGTIAGSCAVQKPPFSRREKGRTKRAPCGRNSAK